MLCGIDSLTEPVTRKMGVWLRELAYATVATTVPPQCYCVYVEICTWCHLVFIKCSRQCHRNLPLKLRAWFVSCDKLGSELLTRAHPTVMNHTTASFVGEWVGWVAGRSNEHNLLWGLVWRTSGWEVQRTHEELWCTRKAFCVAGKDFTMKIHAWDPTCK